MSLIPYAEVGVAWQYSGPAPGTLVAEAAFDLDTVVQHPPFKAGTEGLQACGLTLAAGVLTATCPIVLDVDIVASAYFSMSPGQYGLRLYKNKGLTGEALLPRFGTGTDKQSSVVLLAHDAGGCYTSGSCPVRVTLAKGDTLTLYGQILRNDAPSLISANLFIRAYGN